MCDPQTFHCREGQKIGKRPRTLNRKFPMVPNLLQSGLSLSGVYVLWWPKNPYFESLIPNGSKSYTFRACLQWYVGALVVQKPVLGIANSQWFKAAYIQGCPSVVSRCFGGSKTRTLNCKFPILQSLLQSGLSLSGMWVLWWVKTPYFTSAIPNGSNSHTFGACLQWVWVLWWLKNADFEWQIPNGSKSHPILSGLALSGMWMLWWLKDPYFESQIPNGSTSHTFRACPEWYVGALVAQKPRTWNRKFPMVQRVIHSGLSLSGMLVPWWPKNPYFESQIPNGSTSHSLRAFPHTSQVVPQWYVVTLVAQKPLL